MLPLNPLGEPDVPSRGRCALPVTLVIPVRNEQDALPRLLTTIDEQTCAPAEVVLVDGGSSDRTAQIARDHAAQDDRYRVIELGRPATPGHGRNVGIKAAQHDWIALTDAGISLEPTWLQRLWAAHEADLPAEAIFGSFEFDTRSAFEESASIAYGSPTRPTPLGRSRGPSVASCLLHRRAFSAAGDFPDLRAGEDTIFLRRLGEAGVRTTWAPGAVVWWRMRPDLASTVERFRVYSYHNALAGEQRHWHYRLARSYAPVLGGVVLAGIRSRGWLALSAAALGARVVARLARHLPDRAWTWLARPERVARVTLLMLASDAAAFVGWAQASGVGRRRTQDAEQGPTGEREPSAAPQLRAS